GGGPPPAHQHGVRPRREPRQHHVGLALLRDGLRRQARREQAFPRPLQHRPLVGPTRLAHIRHYHRAAKALSQNHGLLEGRIRPRASVQAHQQAREHGYGSTAKVSSSRSRKPSSSPVIGSRPWSSSSRPLVSRRSATTTYSVPRRRSATRRRSRTARSRASNASGVSERNSRIGGTPRSGHADPSHRSAHHAADHGRRG